MLGRHQRKIFTPNPHAKKTSTQNFRISHWHSYPELIYTQQGTKPACQEDTNTKFSHFLLAQVPRTRFTHNKPPNPHTRKTSTEILCAKRHQSLHRTRCRYSNSHACHAKATAKRWSPKRSHPRADVPSPTPATHEVAEWQSPKWRQSVHWTPHRCNKSHACHAKIPAERRSPQRQSIHGTPGRCTKPHACHAKAAAEPRSPKQRQSVRRTRHRCSKSHACRAKVVAGPKTTQQVPRLPHKRSGRAVEPKTTPHRTSDPSSGGAPEPKQRQNVHQTPHKCRKPTPPRLPRKSSGKAKEPKTTPQHTSDPLQMQPTPRMPGKSTVISREISKWNLECFSRLQNNTSQLLFGLPFR